MMRAGLVAVKFVYKLFTVFRPSRPLWEMAYFSRLAYSYYDVFWSVGLSSFYFLSHFAITAAVAVAAHLVPSLSSERGARDSVVEEESLASAHS